MTKRRIVSRPLPPIQQQLLLLIVIISPLLLDIAGKACLNLNCPLLLLADAVSVQRLNVPDLVVIDQQLHSTQARLQQQQQPEAASLINQNQPAPVSWPPQDLHLHQQQQQQNQWNGTHNLEASSQQQTITFECLISYDKRKDKNLIVKWHHDDRVEPIYQWIPELNKRSIAPHYRSYIAPIVAPQNQQADNQWNNSNSTSNLQLLEAGFRLVKPSKELGGKYTCSAISTQNDDSKWKKMIVYAPPRFFRFNATRTDIGAQLADQRERLILLTQPASISMSINQQQSLPLAYRMRGIGLNNDNNNNQNSPSLLSTGTTISPQMYSTIDYVNVNQQRIRLPHLASASSSSSSAWQTTPTQAAAGPVTGTYAQQPQQANIRSKHNGVKLVCDIDQVFPVPEVSIYRLAKLDGSHPDKLAKLDTRIERYPQSGLYHVQVISVLEDDELQMKYGVNESVYFECSIALTNLELSKYADNKRSLIYRPGLLTNSELELSNNLEQTFGVQNSAAFNSSKPPPKLTMKMIIMMLSSSFTCWFLFPRRLQLKQPIALATCCVYAS